MAEYLIQEESLKLLKNSVREKTGNSDNMDIYDIAANICLMDSDTDIGAPKKGVLFYDYDGTLLYSYTIEEARQLTALPELPIHENLISHSWTHTLEEVNTTMKFLEVGAVYKSNKIILTINITTSPTTLPLYFYQSNDGGVSINWGDGSNDVTFPGANISINTSHTYNYIGKYNISFELLSGTMKFGATEKYLLDTRDNMSLITDVVLGFDVSSYTTNASLIPSQNLEKLIICDGVTTIVESFINGTYNQNLLQCVVIPSSVTKICYQAFYRNDNLKTVILPESNCIQLGGSVFAYCSSLEKIIVPNVTHIDSKIVNYISWLFYGCYNLKEIYFKNDIPPVIDEYCLYSIDSNCKIYVQMSSEELYKTANNWSNESAKINGTILNIKNRINN